MGAGGRHETPESETKSLLLMAIVVIRVSAFYAGVPQVSVKWGKCLLTHHDLNYKSRIPTVGKMNLL